MKASRDKTLSTEHRCEDLLQRMTLEEKVGQIPVHCRFSGWHSILECSLNGEEYYIDMPQEPLFVFGEGLHQKIRSC